MQSLTVFHKCKFVLAHQIFILEEDLKKTRKAITNMAFFERQKVIRLFI